MNTLFHFLRFLKYVLGMLGMFFISRGHFLEISVIMLALSALFSELIQILFVRPVLPSSQFIGFFLARAFMAGAASYVHLLEPHSVVSVGFLILAAFLDEASKFLIIVDDKDL